MKLQNCPWYIKSNKYNKSVFPLPPVYSGMIFLLSKMKLLLVAFLVVHPIPVSFPLSILYYNFDIGFWMLIFAQFECRLLDPKLKCSSLFYSRFVESYILQLIVNLPSQMSLHIRELVAALVWWMQSVQIVELKGSLLLFFARLVMSS